MKWSLQQLNKARTFEFEDKFEFNEEIKAIDDIIGISDILVNGSFWISNDDYIFDLNIKCKLILEDALTLNPVDFLLDLEVVETYSFNEGNYDARIITTNTIDLRDAVWENILLAKPIRFVLDETRDN